MSTPQAASPPPVQGWRKWREAIRPWQGIIFFLGGFLWDSLTLVRIDRLMDNLLLLAYLSLLGGLLVVESRLLHRPEGWPEWLVSRASWLTDGIQFFFGGLLSAYVIFYFKSAPFGRSMIFLAFLVGLMVVNEFLNQRLRLDRARLPLYSFCCFSFLLFFSPVITGYAGGGIFTMAAVLALAVTAVVGWAMNADIEVSRAMKLRRPLLVGAGVIATLFALDCAGLIPPVPLALMGGGIFHGVDRTNDGYALTYEKPPWYAFWRDDDSVFRWREGSRVMCFSAIFAPTGMKTEIVHVWEYYDPELGWTERSRIPFDVKGGRDGGFRGYTGKRNIVPGDWRVRVQTNDGRELGQFPLVVEPAPEGIPVWKTRFYQ